MIKPLPGYVLVEPIKEESQMGGVYMPEDQDDKPSKGKVIDVNHYQEGEKEDFKLWHRQVTLGIIVIFKKWTNQEVKLEGKEYLLVKFDELLGIIE
jgi:chaperonin GroES